MTHLMESATSAKRPTCGVGIVAVRISFGGPAQREREGERERARERERERKKERQTERESMRSMERWKDGSIDI